MADDMQTGNGQWVAADDLGNGSKVPRVKLQVGADGIATDVSAESPLPAALPRVLPTTWSTPTATPQDARLYGDIEVQFVGTPSTPYTPVRSLDGTNFVAANAYDKDGNAVTSINAAGIYSFDGGGYLKFSAGAGSVLTMRAGA